MLKKNWNWRNNKLFRHIFVIGEISIGRGGAGLKLRAGLCSNWGKQKGVRKFSARFLAFSNEISTVQKIVLSSSPGQGNFRGLEASRPRPRPRTSKCVLEDVLEAKDILEDSTFDCDCVCGGQGHPRGLHLWLRLCLRIPFFADEAGIVFNLLLN